MALSDELEALAKRHGALSYRNRADTQHPAYGFTEDGLNGLIDEVLAKWGTPQPVVREPLTDSQAQAGACEWKHDDDDDFWDTECGQPWRFDDGGPKENHMNFCPCCGKPLRIKGGQHGTE